MKIKSKARYILEYIGLRLFCFLVRLLPQHMTITLGQKIGIMSRRLLKKRIHIAHSNLQHAYGEGLSYAERNRIINRLLSLLGEAFVESVIFTSRDANKNIHVEGLEHLEKALKMNKGAILLGPHFGLWELAGHVFGSRLENSSTVYKPLKNPYVDNYLIKTRKKSGLTLIPSKNALRPVLGNLRKGRAVVILFDQNAGRQGLPATFFGKPAFTYSAPAVFALKTGCPVIPAYMIKDVGFRKHRLVIKESFPLINTGNKEKDLLANTQQYNDFMEAIIRKHPDHWFGWIHRRWKGYHDYSGKIIT